MNTTTDLITNAEVAELLDVSARRVQALAAQRADFPTPIYVAPDGRRLWARADVELWNRTADRRPGRPRRSE